jgi:UrcA family protein
MNVTLRNNRRLAVVLPIVALAGLAFSGTSAGEEVRTEQVRFPDLNVNTTAGVQALYKRIHRAAQHVCSETDPILRAGAAACVAKAEGKAIASLDLPQLTAYYNAKSGNRRELLSSNR